MPSSRCAPLSTALASTVLSVVAAMAACLSGAVAAEPTQYIRIDGATGAPNANDVGGLAGTAVAGAGDVNGDGRPDVIVGAPDEDSNARANSGSAYVVFGQPVPATIDLANLGAQGFRIDGASAGELAGRSVSGVGDMNGDGRADVIVGAPGAFSASQEDPRKPRGKAYVVFGKSSVDAVDLAALGSGGFPIVGRRFHYPDAFGFAVAGAGDFNRDGRADVIVSAPGNPGFEERFTRAAVYVIFGKRSSSEVRIDRLGRRGVRLGGLTGIDISVAGAGDVNRDGRADVIVGAAGARFRGQSRGSAYVVFGSRRPRRTINLARPARWGFVIGGANRGDAAGQSVAGVGDVNRDRLADVIVGDPGFQSSGAAYVVFGRRSFGTVSLVTKGRPGLKRLDSRGFSIVGEPGSLAGFQVAGVRDVNADKRPDVALTAGGSVYAVFGKRSAEPVRLAALAAGGFKIDGVLYEPTVGELFPRPGGFAAVAGAGDINADGRGDMVVGAPNASRNGRLRSGSAYVFFSR